MKDIKVVRAIANDVWIARGKKEGQSDENWKIAEEIAKNIDGAIEECAKRSANDISEIKGAVDYWKRRSYEVFNVLLKIKKIPGFMFLLWLFTDDNIYNLIKEELKTIEEEIKQIV